MSDVMIRVAQIKISIDDSIDKVKELVLKQLRLKEHELLDYRIYMIRVPKYLLTFVSFT